jgi:hypothetical protein
VSIELFRYLDEQAFRFNNGAGTMPLGPPLRSKASSASVSIPPHRVGVAGNVLINPDRN